jgi:Fe-S-cluster containining protein
MNDEREWVDGEIRLSVGGKPLELKMTVPANPVTVRTMLPVFRQMSNSFVELEARAAEAEGREISCKAGCGACCRQAVPLSETEAFEIAEIVESFSEPKRSELVERFADGCRRLAKAGWFEKLDLIPGTGPEERKKVIGEYFSEGVACPFLEEESCSIHERRPLACREHLVTSPPEFCRTPLSEEIKGVDLPVKPSEALRAVNTTGNLGRAVNFVPMILALEWAARYKEDRTEKTGEGWMAEFFSRLL